MCSGIWRSSNPIKKQISQKLSLIKFFLAPKTKRQNFLQNSWGFLWFSSNLSTSLISDLFTTTQAFLAPDPIHKCPCAFCCLTSSLRRGPDGNLGLRWHVEPKQLGMRFHALVTLLGPVTNPEGPSLTTLSNIHPFPCRLLYLLPYSAPFFLIALITTWGYVLVSVVIVYLLQENTSAMKAGTQPPSSSCKCWLNEWPHSL